MCSQHLSFLDLFCVINSIACRNTQYCANSGVAQYQARFYRTLEM